MLLPVPKPRILNKNPEQHSRLRLRVLKGPQVEGSGLERVLTRVLILSAKASSDRIFIPTTALQFPPLLQHLFDQAGCLAAGHVVRWAVLWYSMFSPHNRRGNTMTCGVLAFSVIHPILWRCAQLFETHGPRPLRAPTLF